jgi:outer membrane protein OmpA-like peptidoglycan-associated protein/opacity protein-like surface antigen
MKKCIAIIGASILCAWTAAAADVPKGGVYLGYEYVRFNPGGVVPDFNANGGGGQFIYNFNGWLGAVVDAGAVHNGDLTGFHLDSTFVNFLGGPRFSIRRSKRFVPYFQALFGGVYSTSSTQLSVFPIATPAIVLPVLPTDLPVTARLNTSQTKFAMTAGGGLDIKVGKHMMFRPIGIDYYLTKLGNGPIDGGDSHQNNLRYSAGVTFLFGGEKPTPVAQAAPPPPRTKTCPDGRVVNYDATCPKLDITLAVNASSQEVCQGDTTPVVATLPNGANAQTYAWSVNGEPVSQGPNFTFGTADRQPGVYKVAVNVNGNNFNPVSAETTITVKEYQPPTGTAQANPAQVRAGEKSDLTASFQGQCGGTIQAPTFEASEGSVQGSQFDSTGVQFDPANRAEQRKTITITAKAADNRSVGTATTSVEVIKSAGAIRLPDVLFSANSSRVNNCGKRILLEQLRAYVERDPTGTVTLVGHVSSDEKPADLAMQRAMNAAAVITAGTGVCLSVPQSQVQISAPGADQMGVGFEAGFCQSSVAKGPADTVDARRVEVWFVPTGGALPSSVTNSQSASAMSVSGLGCPK